MDAVIRTWILNTISDDLANTVSQHGVTTRVLWLSIESQFLGNHTTHALYADQEFCSFSQGDLPVAEYYRRYKKLAEDLRDLGEHVSGRILVLNIIRGLNKRFLALGFHLRRTYPLPNFLQVRDDLALEELTMANTPPTVALVVLTALGSIGSTTPPTPSTGAPRHSQQPATQLPAPSQPSGEAPAAAIAPTSVARGENAAVVGTPPLATPTLDLPLARGPTIATTTPGQGLSTCGQVSDHLPRLARHKARPRLRLCWPDPLVSGPDSGVFPWPPMGHLPATLAHPLPLRSGISRLWLPTSRLLLFNNLFSMSGTSTLVPLAT
jgi:hypothetical protein